MDLKKTGARLEVDGKTYDLPLITDNNGKKVIDISSLRKESGYIVYDPGFGNSATCQSSISTVDGEKGILKYRGYDIADLVENCEFVEIAHLLVKGELPNLQERKNYQDLLNSHSLLHVDMQNFFRSYPHNSHPMAILAAMVTSLSAFYPEMATDPVENIDLTVTRLLSKMRTIAAYSYRQSKGLAFVEPSYKYSYCENFLNMMFQSPVNKYEADPIHVKALNQLLILHADHEQNCSTTAVRLVCSSDANLYAAISSGICALWGPKHGGANQQVLEMLSSIVKDKTPVEDIIARAKDKTNPFVLYGFGHRIYKTMDPRAIIAKKLYHDLLEKTGIPQDPMFDVALRLEEAALKDPYFVDRKLYPNVDFYSGLIFRAIGIPSNMLTVLFAMGRLPGWIAHYLEWHNDPFMKINRPRQIYTGPESKKVIPIENR